MTAAERLPRDKVGFRRRLAPPTDILTAPKPTGEPALAPPAGGGPMVIPPTPPKDPLLGPPKGRTPPQISAPGALPGLSLQDAMPSGPTLPAGAIDGPALPATPVSRFRPQ